MSGALQGVAEAAGFKNISASAKIVGGPGKCVGVLCNSSASGTLTLYDNTAASGNKITNATPLVAGQFYPVPAQFQNGLYCALGGTADVSVFASPD